jgi:glycosyltransferase involved in cell wall biosynthesis
MRVLLTTDTIGGVWTFTKDLCSSLLAYGHDVALVSVGRLPSAAQREWCVRMRAFASSRFRYDALDVPLEWMQENARAYDAAERSLLQIARIFHADLIHANQFCFGALPTHLPKVVTAHSDVLSWAEVCRPEGLADSAWLRRYCALVNAGLRGATSIVAPTQWMAHALRRGFPAARNAAVILNGRTIEDTRVDPCQRVLQAVAIGRLWDEAKGFSVLAGMQAAMPVVVAGETTLEDAAAAGALSEEEVLALFRCSSVYVATSVYEPFGLAPLEAALCGCAVVANDIESLREVWGDAAIYYRGAAQLRGVLDRLVERPDELRCARLRSQRRGLELSIDKMVDGYLGLYTELLTGRLTQERQRVAAYAG